MVQHGVNFMLGLGGKDIDSYIKGWQNAGGNSDAAIHFTDLKQ